MHMQNHLSAECLMLLQASLHGNAAGPLLLNALLKYLGRSRNPMRDDELPLASGEAGRAGPAMHRALDADSLAYGCCLVALLGLTAAAKVWSPHMPLMACTALRSGPAVSLPHP